MHKNHIHRRRMVFNGVIRQIAEQLPVRVPGRDGENFPLSIAMLAWKEYLRGLFFPRTSSEDVIRRDDWNDIKLAMEAWAAHRGVTFKVAAEEPTE